MQAISAFLFQALSFLLVLGVVVLVHELGHYLAARFVGVRVEVFSVGFGPSAWARRRGDTEFRLSWIPLGGYVRMSGDSPLEGDVTGAPHEFESRRAWEKLLILAAGPAFNLVLAVLLLAGAYVLGMRVPAWLQEPVVVAGVVPDSPADRAGVLEGDRILAVDGESVETWETYREKVMMRPGADVALLLQRSTDELTLSATFDRVGPNAIGWDGTLPTCRLEVVRVVEGGAAAAAGVLPGDVVRTLDGTRTCSTGRLASLLQEGEGRRRRLGLDREGRLVSVELAPIWSAEREAWMIGIEQAPPASVLRRHGAVAALRASLADNWRWTKLLFETVGRLVTGRMSVRAMSGPVEIAGIASEAVQLGFVPLLQLMALISLNLGILNLLPIPVLDGGRIAVVGVEAVRGRELGASAREWILRVGFAMIVVLMVVVLYFDILKRLEG